jgi:hypothetical protein
MSLLSRVASCVAVLAILAFLAGPASASLISEGTPYDDGSNPPWVGTTFFDFDGSLPHEGDDLEGYVEWIVYGPGDFPAGFAGYVPTPGELTYAYQVFVTGSAAHPVSSLDVVIFPGNPANNIGSFSGLSVVGDAPSANQFVPAGANWDFAGIPTGGSSQGLAFSSPNVPTDLFGSLIDGGQTAVAIPLPTPSDVPIPEPSSVALALFGSVGLVAFRFARRRRRNH